MDRNQMLRGERPVNPLHYQQPTHEELYARVRYLEVENGRLREIVREVVDANETREGALGLVANQLDGEHVELLESILPVR